MALESTEPLTEMSTRNLPGNKSKVLPVSEADNLNAVSRRLGNVATSTCHKAVGPPPQAYCTDGFTLECWNW
jgi:hypothetical protein